MIQTRHLFTLTADVPKIADLGATPNGARRIATVTGGSFKGERLNGTIQPAPGGPAGEHGVGLGALRDRRNGGKRQGGQGQGQYR